MVKVKKRQKIETDSNGNNMFPKRVKMAKQALRRVNGIKNELFVMKLEEYSNEYFRNVYGKSDQRVELKQLV